MKTWLAVVIGTVPLLFSGAALAQTGGMMNGSGWMGGYGGMGGYGILVPILLVVVVVGLVMWFIKQKGK